MLDEEPRLSSDAQRTLAAESVTDTCQSFSFTVMLKHERQGAGLHDIRGRGCMTDSDLSSLTHRCTLTNPCCPRMLWSRAPIRSGRGQCASIIGQKSASFDCYALKTDEVPHVCLVALIIVSVFSVVYMNKRASSSSSLHHQPLERMTEEPNPVCYP